MKRVRALLGYSGAVLTVAAAALTPFLLYGWFQKVIGSAGLRVHPSYTGGELSHVIEREGYRITVNRPVIRHWRLQRIDSFVQMTWSPAASLPPHVTDAVDLDGDGAPDLLVRFEPARLVVDVAPLVKNGRPMLSDGVTSFSALIARVDGAIVVRTPASREW